jgi:hypothetical protein
LSAFVYTLLYLPRTKCFRYDDPNEVEPNYDATQDLYDEPAFQGDANASVGYMDLPAGGGGVESGQSGYMDVTAHKQSNDDLYNELGETDASTANANNDVLYDDIGATVSGIEGASFDEPGDEGLYDEPEMAGSLVEENDAGYMDVSEQNDAGASGDDDDDVDTGFEDAGVTDHNDDGDDNVDAGFGDAGVTDHDNDGDDDVDTGFGEDE